MTSAVTSDTVGLDVVTNYAERVLIPVVGGAPLNLATAAMLMIIICSMKPEIEGEELAAAIQDVTAYLVLQLAPQGARAN